MTIHYLRPPDREQVFRQRLLFDDGNVLVTLARHLVLAEPLAIGGSVALESGSDVVWFTFPRAWHDIGLFHDARGEPTGLYANILTPPAILPGNVWRTTDLFLDVWVPHGGRATVLDRDEFDEAHRRGWIDPPTREAALAELERILSAWEEGIWPPPAVAEWSRARALAGVVDANP